jgi:methionyl-tRNA synthetase
MANKFFQISTAIDYPSARFHLGHAYEKVCADVIARWKRLQGYDVHFSTGTDCHGLKIQRAAEKEGKTPEQFVKEMSQGFKELCKALNISYDDFIMTIEKRHERTVIDILNKLKEKGDIYKGEYEGNYCVDCETFYTEKDLEEDNCPIHKRKCEILKEKSYFFKLSKYQKEIAKQIKENDLIWPEKKKNEILNRFKEPIKDLAISREKVQWGIPLPFDKNMTAFVWVDALINYLTTVEYPNKKFKDFWPALHIIGPDIVWHHTAIWYSILLALGLNLPKVTVHGFINLEGEKLSKARGITIDPIELVDKYTSDTLRYYLMRGISFGQDGDFSESLLLERHNSELADKLGNLISRVSALAETHGLEKTENKLLKKLNQKGFEKHLDNFEIDKALNLIFEFIDTCNLYVQENKLWEKEDKKKLFELVDSIKAITILLSPFIPDSCDIISEHFGFPLKLGEIEKPYAFKSIKKIKPLFIKIKLDKEEKKLEEIKITNNKLNKPEKIEGVMNTASFQDWTKLDLRVAKIKKVEDIEGADKLYKLEIDLGELGKRTICAGIKQFYPKDKLKNKKIIVIANLEPRKLKGIESQGMLLAAGHEQGKCVLLTPDADIEPGTRIS